MRPELSRGFPWCVPLTRGFAVKACLLLALVAACGGGRGGVPPGIALLGSNPPQGSTISVKDWSGFTMTFSIVCREDDDTFLEVFLTAPGGLKCGELFTHGNGVHADAGRATMISVAGGIRPTDSRDCRLPATTSGAVVGTTRIISDVNPCGLSQTFQVAFTIVP
jgi:hypothetical protein